MILYELIDYEILRVIWWALLGVLLIGFALTDGFDMGVGALLPFVAKTDVERRVVINTVGPVWEGNQVWFILGGGAIFAAWPPLYAVSFSGFYLAMFVVLAAFIVRPVAFKYRSKRDSATWRKAAGTGRCLRGAVPALLFGVAVGNVLLGVPFHLNDMLMPRYDGNFAIKFIGLLRPFALLAGVVSLSMLLMHGAAWLSLKTEGLLPIARAGSGPMPGSWPWRATRLPGSGWRLGRRLCLCRRGGHRWPVQSALLRSGAGWVMAHGLCERPWIVVAPSWALSAWRWRCAG
jgi:cytochrome d ubiquinol oxidase subunit II